MVDVCCNKVVIFREDLLFDVFRAAFVLFGCISDPFQEALQASLGKTTVITEMQGCRYQTCLYAHNNNIRILLLEIFYMHI